jgi:hypothetical protein
MSYFLGISLITAGCLVLFIVGCVLLMNFIRWSHFSDRLKPSQRKMKNLYHWNGKGYYQRILK